MVTEVYIVARTHKQRKKSTQITVLTRRAQFFPRGSVHFRVDQFMAVNVTRKSEGHVISELHELCILVH